MSDVEVDGPLTQNIYPDWRKPEYIPSEMRKFTSKVDARLISEPTRVKYADQTQQGLNDIVFDIDNNSMDVDTGFHVNMYAVGENRHFHQAVTEGQEPVNQCTQHQLGGTRAIFPSSGKRDKVKEPISIPKSVFFGTEYKMDHAKRGKALVINNIQYADRRQRPEREDSIKDATAITSILETLLFEPVTRMLGGQTGKEILINNVSSSQLMEIIKDATDPALNDYSDYDCFVMVVLSYGIDGAVMCCEGDTDKLIPVEQIIRQFQADKCPSLAMKPKLFFMQLCPAFTYNIADSVKDTGSSGSSQPEIQSIPTEADILCQISTIPGIYGWYEDNNALSWYMEGLKDALQKHLYNPLREGRKSREIFDVLFHVNRLYLGKLEEQGIRPSQNYSVPHITSTLTKTLRFLPKISER